MDEYTVTKWEEDESELLIKLYKEHLTYTEIADELSKQFGKGRNRCQVAGKLYRLGIQRRSNLPAVEKKSKPLKGIKDDLKPLTTLKDAKLGECLYTIDGTHVCGRETVKRKSYCEHHMQVIKDPVQPKEIKQRVTSTGRVYVG